MNDQEMLQSILDDVLNGEYREEVRRRGRGDPSQILNGGDEFYFNLAPLANFAGRSMCLTISDGTFRLGASYGRISQCQKVIRQKMEDLTGQKAIHGTDIHGNPRTDILRCSIDTHCREKALEVFLNYYQCLRGGFLTGHFDG
jgi:hypothetical protein